jgi:hypothetical protein
MRLPQTGVLRSTCRPVGGDAEEPRPEQGGVAQLVEAAVKTLMLVSCRANLGIVVKMTIHVCASTACGRSGASAS